MSISENGKRNKNNKRNKQSFRSDVNVRKVNIEWF